MLVKDGCSNHDDSNSKLEKYRTVEKRANNEDRVGERGNARGRGSGSRVKCLNGTVSR